MSKYSKAKKISNTHDLPYQGHPGTLWITSCSNGSWSTYQWSSKGGLPDKDGLLPSGFCEARRASHCHSPQTTYSSKSTCCVLSAQKSAMHVVVYADRRTIQHSIVDIIDWSWSYWQIWYPSWHVERFWSALSLHTNFRLLHIPLFCHNIHGGK